MAKSSYLNPVSFHQKVKQNVAETALHALPVEMIARLDSPFRMTEVQEVISLTPCKSPEPNGLTPRFYKVIQEALSPTLLGLYNSISPQVSTCPANSRGTYCCYTQTQERYITMRQLSPGFAYGSRCPYLL